MLRFATVLFTLAILNGNSAAAFTFDDVEFWVGSGPHRAALVVDWSETDEHDPLAWGYRFSGAPTTETMLRAIAAADRRLYARIGSSGPFGVPLYGIGYDRNQTGFALADGTQFDNGIAVTGPSDGVAAIDDHDSYVEGWFDGFWALFHSSHDPFGAGQWEMAGAGISGQVLDDGVWSGLRFATADAMAPRVPSSALRYPSLPDGGKRGASLNEPFVVPEPSGFAWIWLCAFAGMWFRRPARRLEIQQKHHLLVYLSGALVILAAAPCHADEFATTVIDYVRGEGVGDGFDDPTAALGAPTRLTSPDSMFGGAVTPFNAPFGFDELVTIGHGGSLTLGFDKPVFDRNVDKEYGFDLLVFGNSFFFDGDFPNGIVAGVGEEPGTLEVSQNGNDWFTVTAMADTAFPTMGYQDVTAAFEALAGSVPTNFHRPVDPALDPLGMTMPDLINAYAGSGGGTGVDIGPTGLDWIQYVRITNQNDLASMITPEIDAISVVPEPAGLSIFVVFVVCLSIHHWRAAG